MEVPYAPPAKTSIAPLVVAILCLLAGALLLLSGCASSQPPPHAVKEVDLKRYSGRWYEVASYPAWFQRKCAGGTTAVYTPQADGSIRVVNSCRTRDGRVVQTVGRATVVPGSGNARLKVSFGVPFVTGDYWIIALDRTNYRWALVGHPSRKYLWILSRDPHISDQLYREITDAAAAQGYDPSLLHRTSQP
jgi:apolipoprotein D and lipocalin family protein